MSNVKMFCDALPNIPWQEKPADATGPVWRYSENPIIDRNPVEGVARIFNSAVVPYEGKFIGVFRSEQVNGVPYIYLATARTPSTGPSTRTRFPSSTRRVSHSCRCMPTTPVW